MNQLNMIGLTTSGFGGDGEASTDREIAGSCDGTSWMPCAQFLLPMLRFTPRTSGVKVQVPQGHQL